jgi:hypothetical protein
MHLLDTDTLTHLHAGHPQVIAALRGVEDPVVGTTIITKHAPFPADSRPHGRQLGRLIEHENGQLNAKPFYTSPIPSSIGRW